jgi:hypothetical protein
MLPPPLRRLLAVLAAPYAPERITARDQHEDRRRARALRSGRERGWRRRPLGTHGWGIGAAGAPPPCISPAGRWANRRALPSTARSSRAWRVLG